VRFDGAGMVDYLERTLRQARGKNALKDAMKQGKG
jgi:hypothetical protein